MDETFALRRGVPARALGFAIENGRPVYWIADPDGVTRAVPAAEAVAIVGPLAEYAAWLEARLQAGEIDSYRFLLPGSGFPLPGGEVYQPHVFVVEEGLMQYHEVVDEAFVPESSLAPATAREHSPAFVVAEKKRIGGWRTEVIEAEAEKPQRGRASALSLVA